MSADRREPVRGEKTPSGVVLKGRLRRRARGALTACASFLLASGIVSAVPVPFTNCGGPGDVLSVQLLDASIWPPVGTAAPLVVTPTFDPATGRLVSLRVALLLGPMWVFESTGNLGSPVASGFVALPPSIPMIILSPVLPVPAGPFQMSQTFTSPNAGSLPVTINSKVAIGAAINAATANLSLTYNGISGFPTSPEQPGAYTATLQVSRQGGGEVFCFRLALANLSFLQSAPPSVPVLSDRTVGTLAFLLALSGVFILGRRLI